jgi:hypothetical protein
MTMGAVLQFATQLELMTCGECGIEFAVPLGWLKARRDAGENGGSFHCPNGHPRQFRETEVDRLRKRLAAEEQVRQAAEAARDRARHERDEAQRQAKAARTRARKERERCAASLCPVPGCRRSFATTRLQRHLKTKHPGWKPSTVEAVE